MVFSHGPQKNVGLELWKLEVDKKERKLHSIHQNIQEQNPDGNLSVFLSTKSPYEGP